MGVGKLSKNTVRRLELGSADSVFEQANSLVHLLQVGKGCGPSNQRRTRIGC